MQSWGLLRVAFAEREALDGVKGGLKGDQVFVLRRFRGILACFGVSRFAESENN